MEIIYNILKADTKSKRMKEIKKLIDEEFIKETKTEQIYKTSLENVMSATDIKQAHVIARSALTGSTKSINDFSMSSNSYVSAKDISVLLEKLNIIYSIVQLDTIDKAILNKYLNEKILLENIKEQKARKRKTK